MSMRRIGLAGTLITLAALAGGAAAQAERLVVSLSTHRVLITSSYTGFDLVLFGSIERDAATFARRGGYDIVVKVTGPPLDMVVRRKERVAGIWVNIDSQKFAKAPAYLAVLSNRQLTAIAGPEMLRRFEVGMRQTVISASKVVDMAEDDPFLTAFVRLNREHGLYRQDQNALTFLTPNLFRTAIELPSNAPSGNYEVDVKLFGDGVMLARQTSAIEIVKVGLEQFVATAARDHAVLYGLATAALALLTGWLASLVFRRD
jgi:uncharacterized protein (TIGR02186 family)